MFLFTSIAEANSCNIKTVEAVEHALDGRYWVKFTDNTKLLVNTDKDDFVRNNVLAMSLTALATKADVLINVLQDGDCKAVIDRWTYFQIANK